MIKSHRDRVMNNAVVFAIVICVISLTVADAQSKQKPNILVIWGDDIGQSNISTYTFGVVGYRTPNIDSPNCRQVDGALLTAKSRLGRVLSRGGTK